MKKIYNNIINLCTEYQIQDSKMLLDILYLELKTYQKQLDYLKNHKPFNFQKQKLDKYYQEKNDLENRLQIINEKIKIELELLSNLLDN